jgi:hypothetical protein
MSPLEILVLVSFGLWLLLSVAAQFHSERFDRFRAHDVFHLIPNWTFFAPNPGRSDFHLVCRDKTSDGCVGEWSELPLIYARHRWSFLWNPDKRGTKVLTDVVSAICESIDFHVKRGDTKETMQQLMLLQSPYLLLLNVVMNRDRLPERITHRQFMLVETCGFTAPDPPRPILSSPFHAAQPALKEA